jgi:2-keto-4-pentenoate hydratase/2-oxohepta-3-ene-1,7-dioic acid hydratase in catechol pathway
MRLATLATVHGPRIFALRDLDYLDLGATDPALPPTMKALIEAGPEALARAAAALEKADAVTIPVRGARHLPPIPDPAKIICIGLNYKDHAREQGAPIPKEPVVFSKFASTLIGHEQPIELPAASSEVDYEAELVAVIGRRAKHLTETEAVQQVAGYMIGHDVSARDWQKKKDGRQWLLGKSFDTFAPTGPWFVTADEVGDPHQLGIRLRLNGQTMQESNTRDMIFSVPQLLAYISQVFILQPGDLVFTGTPAGVGFARTPPVFLKSGDVVEIEIERLGLLRNPVVRAG